MLPWVSILVGVTMVVLAASVESAPYEVDALPTMYLFVAGARSYAATSVSGNH
jgi:hypothetical protein